MKLWMTTLLIASCSMLGGVCGAWLFSPAQPNHLVVETLTVTHDLVVAAEGEESIGCRLRADGTVTASSGLVTKQIRGQVIAAQSVLATTNPTSAAFDDQRIYAQMTADPRSGGRILAVSKEAAVVPSAGPPAAGHVACIRFHPENGRAEIFTHELARGDRGKAFMLAYNQSAASSSNVAPTTNTK